MKKIFVESSIIIEYHKENKTAVSLFHQHNKKRNLFYINPIVVSEVAYILKKKLNLDIKKIALILKDFQTFHRIKW